METSTNEGQSLPRPTRYSAAQFLIALILLLCASPVLVDLPLGDTLETLLLTLVLVSAIPATGGDRRTLVMASLLAVPAVISKWAHHLHADLLPTEPVLATSIVFAAFIIFHHLRFILGAPEVDVQVLCAGVSTFLMLGLLWTFAFLLLDEISPGAVTVERGNGSSQALTSSDALCLSLGNLSGTGFDDITPESNAARMLAIMEAMTAMFYLAILISRLVALHTERATRRQ